MFKQIPLLSLLLLVPFTAQTLERVDPMRPDAQAGTATQSKTTTTTTKKSIKIDLWVQSIQIGQGERSATINGRLLKIGDKVRGAQLVAIEHDQVRLRRDGDLIKLMFLPRAIKR